jgi:hypothetical protein
MQRLEEHLAIRVQHAIQLRVLELGTDVQHGKRALLKAFASVASDRDCSK